MLLTQEGCHQPHEVNDDDAPLSAKKPGLRAWHEDRPSQGALSLRAAAITNWPCLQICLKG